MDNLDAYNTLYDNSTQDALHHVKSGEYIAANSVFGKVGGADASARGEQELLNSYMMNAFNSAEAAKDRAWQEYMSNSANQRAVADLKAAGFSPFALLGSGANSATTPSGALARSSGVANAPGSAGSDILSTLVRTIATIAVANSINKDPFASWSKTHGIDSKALAASNKALEKEAKHISWDKLLDDIDRR